MNNAPIITNTDCGILLFEIQRGVCAVGCSDCYERSISEEVISWASQKGYIQPLITPNKLSTSQLHQLHQKAIKVISSLPYTLQQQSPLTSTMSLDEVAHWFSLMNSLNLKRADLIGSETTQHPQFNEILNLAQQHDLNVLVYTGRLPTNLNKLHHPSITDIILHLDYTSMPKTSRLTQIFSRQIPSQEYIQEISSLLAEGKEIGLRINFPYEQDRTMAVGLVELQLLTNILDKISEKYQQQLQIKYSFSTKIDSPTPTPHFALESFDQSTVHGFLDFVDYFQERYPQVSLRAERPLFRCAFSDQQWQEYHQKAGLRSTCEMEIAAYPGKRLGLCTVTRTLGNIHNINNPPDLREKIECLRQQAKEMYQLPSFPQCASCSERLQLTCYGGCSGYKVNKK